MTRPMLVTSIHRNFTCQERGLGYSLKGFPSGGR
jgi:hypothetical protein